MTHLGAKIASRTAQDGPTMRPVRAQDGHLAARWAVDGATLARCSVNLSRGRRIGQPEPVEIQQVSAVFDAPPDESAPWE